MLCINSRNNNPYFNLAAEEYFLKNSHDDFFMIWESSPSVVVGKHQNTLAEINLRFIRNNNISVARRLTGGGTVYHDQGNLNFTFIRKGEPDRLVDFSSFIQPVLEFLNKLGIHAIQGAKHEILVDGKKISGNAEHVYKNRVLHHGTLLFDTDLDMLRQSIQPGGGRYESKAVQSNRSMVINLSRCLNENLTAVKFRNKLYDFIKDYYRGIDYVPDRDTETVIMKLAGEKYRTWDWVYGWSPDYSFTRNWANGNLEAQIELVVRKGIIEICHIDSRIPKLNSASGLIQGERHHEENIKNALIRSGIRNILNGDHFENLIFAFF